MAERYNRLACKLRPCKLRLSSPGFESRSGLKLSCGEVFHLTCDASTHLTNIPIFLRVGSSSTYMFLDAAIMTVAV